MPTDFFQRQEKARRSTAWLVAMFCLAVIGIVGSIFAITVAVITQQRASHESLMEQPFPWEIPLLAAAAAMALIIGGTLFKVTELQSGGGTGVAERLGGKRIYPNTADPAERRLLNVVEEMAIASGTPVPPVFFLDKERGINAFAAGYSPSDAVIGITRGCAETLTRDELQGVIAHEFSHILDGDMRMSIRLIGILHGILLLGLVGQLMFRLVAYSRHGRSRRDSGGHLMLALLLVGLALIIVGFIGTFFGNLIKAAVSRQREYLADASAVQFTRNPLGIGGALKKIGAKTRGSRLVAPGAAEASHMYFAQGVREGLSGLWSTHPPLKKRILAIDPQWDGRFPEVVSAVDELTSPLAAGFAPGAVALAPSETEVPVEVVDDAVEQVGEPTMAHREYAGVLLASLPEALLSAAREPYGARAVMYCLLLDRNDEVRHRQLQALSSYAEGDVVELTYKLAPLLEQLDVRARLPLVDLALPALRALAPPQYQRFSKCVVELVRADRRLDLFEWMLSQVLMKHLRPQFEPVRSPRVHYYGLQRLVDACAALLSTVAYAGHADDRAARAFAVGAKHLPELQLQLKSRDESGLGALQGPLQELTGVAAKHRGRLVDACAASICADGHVNLQEAELLRGISDLLDCPMPPLLAGQTVTPVEAG